MAYHATIEIHVTLTDEAVQGMRQHQNDEHGAVEEPVMQAILATHAAYAATSMAHGTLNSLGLASALPQFGVPITACNDGHGIVITFATQELQRAQ